MVKNVNVYKVLNGYGSQTHACTTLHKHYRNITQTLQTHYTQHTHSSDGHYLTVLGLLVASGQVRDEASFMTCAGVLLKKIFLG